MQKIIFTATAQKWNLVFEAGDFVTVDDAGELHSFNDEPAVVREDGMDLMWFEHGVLHRSKGPALITSTGKRRYFINGNFTPTL
jgi:2',3'-cyclic-nucleotide 2'-phosphodiesterase (5'-nucleotidase family)